MVVDSYMTLCEQGIYEIMGCGIVCERMQGAHGHCKHWI